VAGWLIASTSTTPFAFHAWLVPRRVSEEATQKKQQEKRSAGIFRAKLRARKLQPGERRPKTANRYNEFK